MKMRIVKSILLYFLSFAIIFSSIMFIEPLEVKAVGITADQAISWCESMVGQSVGYNDGSGQYQCVEFIQAYYQHLGVSKVSGNGKDYATNALPNGWSRVQGGVPQKGDILVYGAGSSNPYGHVAICGANTSISYHQNYKYVPRVTKQTFAYNAPTYINNYTPYWGYIRPNWASPAPTNPDIGTSTLSYTVGDTVTPTKFTWTKAANATSYNLIIVPGFDFGEGYFKAFIGSEIVYTNLTTNSFETTLAIGNYEVYVESCNFYAKKKSNVVRFYSPDTPRFKITFNSNGGDPIHPSTKTPPKIYKKIGELPTPIREGYAFNGWYTAPSDGTKVTEDSTCEGDCTLYAQWTKVVELGPSPSPSNQANTNPTGNVTPAPSVQPSQNPSGNVSTAPNNSSTNPSVSENSKLVAQKIKVKVASKTYKYSKIKKEKQSFNIGVSGNKGKVSYKVPKKAKEYISVSSKGKVSIKKGAKQGTYKLTVTAAAKGKYKKATKTITIKIK